MIEDSWESTRNAALKKIKNAAKDSDSEVLEELSEVADPSEIQARRANCEAVRMIVDKCLENHREGEYGFKETKKMICEAIAKLK